MPSLKREEVVNQAEKSGGRWSQLGVRHVQAALIYFCFVVTYMKNSANSFILLALTSEENFDKPRYPLDTPTKALIKSSFYFLAVFSYFLGGYVACKINNKFILLTANTITTCFSYILPMFVDETDSWANFWVIKMMQGMCQGFILPTLYGQMSVWIPPDELQYIGPMIFSGYFFARFFVYTSGGSLTRITGGWKSMYYLCGNCGIVWSFAYLGLGAPSPDSCWYISREEKTYIKNKVKVKGTYRKCVPVKQIISNLPMYGTVATQFAQMWYFNSAISQGTINLSYHYKASIQTASFIAGMPYAISIVMTVPITYISYILLKKGKAVLKEIRFCSNSIAQWGFGFWLLHMSASQPGTKMVAFFTVGQALNTFIIIGFRMSSLDLSRNYTSFTHGWTAGMANIGAIIAAVVTTYLHDREEGWRDVYLLSAAAFFLGNLFYTILGSTRIQSYDDYEEECGVDHDYDVKSFDD